MRRILGYAPFQKPITKNAVMLYFFIAVASAVCSSYATSVGSPHIAGSKPWSYPTRPEVFDLNLYKNDKLIRSCKASELVITPTVYRWITAAECLDKDKYDKIEVKFNLHGQFETDKIKLSINLFHVHPDYNNKTGENNIGIIVPFLDYVDKDSSLRRIKLPSKGEKFDGKAADIFVEYKNTTKKGDEHQSVQVKAVQTKIISNTWCAFWYRWSPIKNKNVCASGWYWKGLHNRDVGIPLVVKQDDNNFKLVGIATGVRPWAHWLGLPIEFLDVQPYLDWIREI